jgi:squalene synthase HpnC
VTALVAPKDFVRRPDLLERQWTREESLEYTRSLATGHYENFHVVSALLPKHLHQDFYNVYSFCRWADDLGDEIGDEQESLRLLAWWREQLDAVYAGKATHPVFVALRESIERHRLPSPLFEDLIHAFVQDQTVHSYADWSELFEYCRCSANPVGRLVLRLCGYADERRDSLSDSTCTALQLANFWQDIAVDLRKGRIYLPLNVMSRHGYSPKELRALCFTPEFRNAMREAVDVARALFQAGLPLIKTVDKRLAFDLDLFSRGGLKILDKIERQDYDVLTHRPAVSKVERVVLLGSSLLRIAFSRAA